MPSKNRLNTKYAGVFFIHGTSAGGKPERIYYIRYRRERKMVEEKVGCQFQDDMTPARAAGIRSDRIEGKENSNVEQRLERAAKEDAEKNKPTITNLWNEYKTVNPDLKGMVTDQNRFQNHIEPLLGSKTPGEIVAMDIDRLRLKQLKGKVPATVRNTLELLRRIINFGVNRNRCTGHRSSRCFGRGGEFHPETIFQGKP
ncbi:MAG: hypothetical protein V1793_24250 [Pseudomonadota bacterium]